ncbi:cytidylyltransferase domain-containing protein [Peribacillus muralis]|uniref:cytidylyltransferase domain-containing protein n=1 Tax=Peribacillus muralis TaxID=264697 RepID=UPI00070D119B|nr:glycosyltransferase family protein [Peribacillus muralis]
MKVVAIIQARMGSTRLPGKVMKEVLGTPLLEYQIERVGRSKLISKIVVATTTKETEQPIVELCERLSVDYFRGSEEDVLKRFFEASNKYDAEVVVRLTSDCPLIDPNIIDKIISEYLSNISLYDYISNTIERTYPRGFDVEVFSMKALEKSYREAGDTVYREHVTPYIYHHPDKFKIAYVKHHIDLSSFRLTVDTEEDLVLITLIINSFYEKNKKHFTFEDIIYLLQDKPEWVSINSHIEQKKVSKRG